MKIQIPPVQTENGQLQINLDADFVNVNWMWIENQLTEGEITELDSINQPMYHEQGVD